MFDKDTGHAVVVDFGISKVPFDLFCYEVPQSGFKDQGVGLP